MCIHFIEDTKVSAKHYADLSFHTLAGSITVTWSSMFKQFQAPALPAQVYLAIDKYSLMQLTIYHVGTVQ